MKEAILKPGREISVLRRHPWIFSGAVEKVRGNPHLGEPLRILSHSGKLLGIGSYSPLSQIRIRMLIFEGEERIDKEFVFKRIERALCLRRELKIDSITNAYRVVNSEADGLPGVIIDKYNCYVSCQFLTAGSEYLKEHIIETIKEILNPRGIWERSDTSVREKEGLPLSRGPLDGEVPSLVKIREGELSFLVDIKKGHKTGFYLDQRENRALLQDWSKGLSILNCFSYTGGFGIYASMYGAQEVINVDVSRRSLDILSKNLEINDLSSRPNTILKENVFNLLRKFYAQGKTFDMIILDPPKFVSGKKNIQEGIKGYKELNYSAMRILKPNGLLFTFSCSGLIEEETFTKIILSSALDAKKDALIIKHLSQAGDHLYPITFPEARYLKGFLLRVM